MSFRQWDSSAWPDSDGSRQEGRRAVFHLVKIGALIAGGLTVALWILVAVALLAPILFWLAWNRLEFGPAIGMPLLGFWAIVLATLFLIVGWFGKVVIVAVVFFINPDWLSQKRLLRWPEPTLRNFVAIAILAALMARPHARQHARQHETK
jgi:hypothetical protein